MKSGAAKSALSMTISNAAKASRNEFTAVQTQGSRRVLTQLSAEDLGPPVMRAYGNAKILPGLRIFNGSSAFFMAIIA